MDAVAEVHAALGISQPLHSEAFTLTPPTTVVDPDSVEGELTFSRSGTTATNDGRPILDQAEAAGLTPPESGCRMGDLLLVHRRQEIGVHPQRADRRDRHRVRHTDSTVHQRAGRLRRHRTLTVDDHPIPLTTTHSLSYPAGGTP